MDSKEFAEGYEVRTGPVSVPENPEVASAIESSREWATFFDRLMYDYLNDNLDTVQFYETAFRTYQDWVNSRFDNDRRTINRQALLNPEDKIYASELHFNTLASHTVFAFEQLIREDIPLRSARITDMQTELAMEAADIARQRKLLKFHEDKDDVRSGMVGVYNGQLTEIDTMIILLEIMKDDPEGKLVAVPAPPQFESSRKKGMNADFIIVDRALKQARGLQSKTRISNNNDALITYEYNRITLIDGIFDLGNSQLGNYNSRTGQNIVAAPGLIAMDHLQRLSIKDTPYKFIELRPKLMRAKGIARELSGGRKSYIAFATANVKAKLIHDLYEAPAEPIKRFGHYYMPPKEIV